MLCKSVRGALFACAFLLLVVCGGPIAAANAEVQASRITSPAGPTYVLYDETASLPQYAFTVTGTTKGSGSVALRCYYGAGEHEYMAIASTVKQTEVTPGEGVFSAEVETKALLEEPYFHPCVLRAVPTSNKEAHPPGSAAQEASDPFEGPHVTSSELAVYKNSADGLENYSFWLSTLSSHLYLESVADCGLIDSNLYAPESLVESANLFYCNGALLEEQPTTSGKGTRSELQVDGANAYAPGAASYWERDLNVTIPGTPSLELHKTFEAASGLATVEEVDPTVRCAPEPAVFPPTASSCHEFVSTGVQLERVWQTTHADQAVAMTDHWSSTDGAAHTLSADYSQALTFDGKEGSAYQFPGTSSFTTTVSGQLVGLPAGAGAIYYKEDAATPSGGDDMHPQGAIVYDRAPSEPLSFVEGTHEATAEASEFLMPYQATVPASGAYTLAMTFVQGYGLTEVQSLASEALANYQPPTLAIAAPASGATVSTASVTVSGTASAGTEAPSLTVDGHAVSVGAGGAWSTSVALSAGTDTITALATDRLGLTAEKSVVVTYKPVSSPPPSPGRAHEVGTVSGGGGRVAFTIACQGAAGAKCTVDSTLTTVERIRRGKPVAVVARRRHRRVRSKQVTVGTASLTIPAGRAVRIAIELNRAGRALLAHFGYLPVHLVAVQVSAGHRSTLIAQDLVVVAVPHHHRRHRRLRHR